MIQSLIDRIFSYPGISNFVRNILENNFEEIRKVVRKELDCRRKTLDLGCGTGIFSSLFDDYIGIDISSKFINHARKKYKKQFMIMDATEIKFNNESFDNVFVFGVLHHLNDQTLLSVLSEIRRILNKNGKALILEDIPARQSFNFIGRLVHYFDSGGNIRAPENYMGFLQQALFLERSYSIKSGVCDYAVFVLLKK